LICTWLYLCITFFGEAQVLISFALFSRFVLLIAALIASQQVLSHSGGLNSAGCHAGSKPYHCHRAQTEMVGNRLRCDLDSKSTECNGSGATVSTGYNRDNWKFHSSASPVSSSVLGWYTGIGGSATDVDHVVALKDAYLSGGQGWNSSQKRAFANDPFNHVAAVPYVNRTLKNAYVPLKFITKLRNSRYAFANGKCVEYVDLYVQVKQKYGLRFIHNNINAAKAACR